MERWNVPKKEIKECFSLSYFLFSRRRWNHAGGLLRDETPHYSEETCVLLCLDVSFIFLYETLSCDSMVRGVSHVSEGLR